MCSFANARGRADLRRGGRARACGRAYRRVRGRGAARGSHAATARFFRWEMRGVRESRAIARERRRRRARPARRGQDGCLTLDECRLGAAVVDGRRSGGGVALQLRFLRASFACPDQGCVDDRGERAKASEHSPCGRQAAWKALTERIRSAAPSEHTRPIARVSTWRSEATSRWRGPVRLCGSRLRGRLSRAYAGCGASAPGR
jgi:hypothetical protein